VGVSVAFFGLMPYFDPQFFSATAQPQLGDPVLSFFMLRNCLTG
jgi:hypothetical protein